MSELKPVVIIGGGITGLSLGAMLARRQIPSVVIEKEDRAGGLARSFTYDGHTFDIGPHRFHTDRQDVDAFIREVLDTDARTISRTSWLRFKGQFYPWPLHPPWVLLRFPPRMALGAARDAVLSFHKSPPVSFKDQIINMYGETLYRHFFEGYSSKFLGIVPELTHPDWAKTGVDRAIIDSRLQMQNLWQLAATTILPWHQPDLQFLYPLGGCEQYIRNLQRGYEAAGGRVICGCAVEALETSGARVAAVQAGDELIEASQVVWTGTIHSLARGLGLAEPELNYLALICYNLMLTDGERFDFQWCYHGAPDVIFSRVSIPANFHPSTTPHRKRSMCVEVTCSETDHLWEHPEEYIDRVLLDMKRQDLLKADHEVLGVEIEKVPWSYPIYCLDYRQKLRAFQKDVGQFENVIMAGRLGRFWYNNMDHCIEAAFVHADDIARRLGVES